MGEKKMINDTIILIVLITLLIGVISYGLYETYNQWESCKERGYEGFSWGNEAPHCYKIEDGKLDKYYIHKDFFWGIK